VFASSRRLRFASGLALLLLLCFVPHASAAKTTVNSIGSFSAGEAGGFFHEPGGVAVNETGEGGVPAGTVYVGDKLNARIEQFGPGGEFVRTWGWGVKDGDLEFETCAVAANCRRGIPGTGAGQIGEETGQLGLAVDQSSGRLYVTDQFDRRVDIFSARGLFLGAFGWGALNQSNEFQFCTQDTGCSEFSPVGRFVGRGGKFGPRVGGLAVAPSGDLYVANTSYARVDVYQPIVNSQAITGVEFVAAFGKDVVEGNVEEGFEACTVSAECKAGQTTAEPGGFAEGAPTDVKVNDEGGVFALDAGNDRIQRFDNTPSLVDSAFGSTAIASTFGAGLLQQLAVDSSTTPNHLLVAGSRAGEGNRLAVLELDDSGAATAVHGEDLTIGLAAGLAVAPATLGGDVYLSSSDNSVSEGGNRVLILGEAPTMDPVTVVGGTTATFTGSVVSNEIPTFFHFEFSTDQVHWTSVPEPEADAGTGPGALPVSQEVTGLTGSQAYFVRLAANRPAGGGRAISKTVEFTTAAARPVIAGGGASDISDSRATLNAKLNPENQSTSYHFEYGLQECSVGPCTSLASHTASGGEVQPVSENLTELAPDTVYHFRLVAANGSGETKGPDRTFRTLPSGSSLPDGRVYELVTPPESGGLFWADLIERNNGFDRPLISPNGESALFYSEGSLPGTEGNGLREAYEAVRGPDGWTTRDLSPSGAQAAAPHPGGSSADHSISFWNTGTNGGSLETVPGEGANVQRRGVGAFELIGQGSEGQDPQAEAAWASPDGGHVIFKTRPGSAKQLEPDAAPEGTAAIYDRTGDGVTHVVSLPPGNLPFGAGEEATYEGASEDGAAVVFEVAGTMYVRLDDTETEQVATEFPGFEGVAEGGSRVFYLKEGNLFAFDTGTETATQIGAGGETTPVNISTDGSHVYFSSPQELAAGAHPGERNLYVWDGGSSIEFVAVLSQSDFEGFDHSFGSISLARWSAAIGPEKTVFQGRAVDPSRTTPDGKVLVFQSHGVAGYPYDSGGFSEIYRYDAVTQSLTCVSCNPAGESAESEAELQTLGLTAINAPSSALSRVYNVTDDGSEVFFNTADALVPDDTDNVVDVYEWKEGQVSLISSGRSSSSNRLYSMTPNGHDVLFKTTDSLVPEDRDQGLGSIYDARVGGGFGPRSETPPPCSGEPCQGVALSPPAFPSSGTSGSGGPGNVKPHRHKHRKHHKHGHHRHRNARGSRR
jgi:hypothetical protein